jgi:hypothetical protein
VIDIVGVLLIVGMVISSLADKADGGYKLSTVKF